MGRHIIDTERDEIVATQFTVNREIEHLPSSGGFGPVIFIPSRSREAGSGAAFGHGDLLRSETSQHAPLVAQPVQYQSDNRS
jgi:hypothetical protein